MAYLECRGGLSAAEIDALRERWRDHVAGAHAIILETPMAMTVRNLRDALERPPPPRPWGPGGAYRPLPPSPPFRSLVPPVPWIMRGDNAALSLGAILLGALALLWWGM
jgi:hypothetical protein